MIILVKSASADCPELMTMLKSVTIRMCDHLATYGIFFRDYQVRIWIKEYGDGAFFPKVEFATNNDYELQYDISRDGYIKEAHFKFFEHTADGSVKRHDIDKFHTDPFLAQVDDILRGE